MLGQSFFVALAARECARWAARESDAPPWVVTTAGLAASALTGYAIAAVTVDAPGAAGNALLNAVDVVDLFEGAIDGLTGGEVDSSELTTGPSGTPSSGTPGELRFGYEGRYEPGVGSQGEKIIQSSTGPPIVANSGAPVSPNDVTWT